MTEEFVKKKIDSIDGLFNNRCRFLREFVQLVSECPNWDYNANYSISGNRFIQLAVIHMHCSSGH